MDMTINQQMALDEALVPHASRLRIGKRNFHLRSHITSKESTLQLVYDVMRLTPFYNAFFGHSRCSRNIYVGIMGNCHSSSSLNTFQDGQQETYCQSGEIMAILRFLGHSGEIRKLIDVNIKKLHQPWRSIAAVINKCPCGKSTGYDSLRFLRLRFFGECTTKRT
nr:hypothetical protein [Tanacetum cinerariifolium]